MTKSVDIIIPVYRPPDSFESELEILMRQSLPFSRLIILHTLTGEEKDDRDVKALIIGQVGEERLIYRELSGEEFDHAGTRNLGVSLSDADAFCCMTDDALPQDEEFLARLLDALYSDERVAIAYARQVARPGADPREAFARKFNYPAESLTKSKEDVGELGIKAFFASNVAAIYRRGVFDRLGGFRAPAVFNEDMIYAAAALEHGYMIYYASDAQVSHSHEVSAMTALRRNFDNGLSQALHPEIFGGVSSESEGMRFVREGVKYLCSSGQAALVPGFILSSGLKYIGFRLGKGYECLPEGLIRRLSCAPHIAMRAIKGEK